MKKFAFLALLFFIFYIAGMYESPALMVLFLTQIFLMAVMGVLAVYLKNHLLVSFGEELVWAEKDCPFTWSLRAENSGRLPISRFCMSFRVYEKKKAGKKGKCMGTARTRRVRFSLKIRLSTAGFIFFGRKI